MRISFVGLAFASLTTAAGSATSEGLKIVVSESFPAGRNDTTEYVAGDRARVEWRISSRTSKGQGQERGFRGRRMIAAR